MPEFDFLASLPAISVEIGLTILAIVLVFLESYLHKDNRRNIAYVAAVSLAFLAVAPVIWAPTPETTGLYWGGMIRYDAFGGIFKMMILLAASLVTLMSIDDKGVHRKTEFHIVIVVATLGASLLVSAADLIMLFVALETLSVPMYILAAYNRTDRESAESGIKYFLFGSFASALLLYGFSLLYGFTGTTNLQGIAVALTQGGDLVAVLVAMVLVIAGFGFKISAVPFHFWTPDVYHGAPTPVTGFLSVASKAASFAILVRFLLGVFPDAVVIEGQTVQQFWVAFVAVASVASMTFGNIMALRQSNIKRLLAYSSIAQAGYALIGVAALQGGATLNEGVNLGIELGISAVAFYMFMYTFSNLAIFAGIIVVTKHVGSEEIRDYAGLQRRNPWLALALAIGILSLAGIPPAAGFFGKFFLFQAAVESSLAALAIIGVLNSIIALYYYLVVIKVMYVDQGPDDDKPFALSTPYAWALGLSSIVVLLLGTIAVTPIIDWAREGANALAQAVSVMVAGM
ncbi:MAG: NADH-quinone oxidoreductase subunit N [Anaerolineaceae bacterium]|nr:NADH-quinone oxidoreductase subunit N [Anaerolineaceae bacterium]